MASEHAKPSVRGGTATWLVLLLCLSLTFLGARQAGRVVRAEQQSEMRTAALESFHKLQDRLREYQHALRGVQSLMVVAPEVDRRQWHDFVDVLLADERLPGLRGLEYIQHVPADQLPEFIEQTRQLGYPDFYVHPEGERASYSVIKFIEPLSGNARALGFDVQMNRPAKPAQDASRDSGQPTLTPRLGLIQDAQGAVFYLPVYRAGQPVQTVAQRRAALQGWVAAVLDVGRMLADAPAPGAGLVMQVYDGPSTSSEHRIYASGAVPADVPEATRLPLEVGSRQWMVRYFPQTNALADARRAQFWVGLLGVVGSLLVTGIVWSYTTAHRRAHSLAQRMTDDLRASEARWRSAFEDAGIGMALVSPEGQIMRANHAFCRMLGYSPEQLQALTWQQLTDPEDLAADLKLVQECLDGQRTHFQLEKRYRHKQDRTIWAILSASLIRDERGGSIYFVSQVQDITERKEMEQELRHHAVHDKLTGLLDRAVLDQRLVQAWHRAKRYPDQQFAVLFIDVDRFKQVNDRLGHEAGDFLLKQMADRLRKELRVTDTIGRSAEAGPTAARIGGDEFVLLLEPIADAQAAVAVARRLQMTLAQPYELKEQGVEISVSMGVATSFGDYASPSDLLHAADMGMYRAKQAGRGHWVILADEDHLVTE